MKVWVYSAALVLALGTTTQSVADSETVDLLADNPFIELYKLRVTQARLNLDRRKAIEELAASKLERARKLVVKKAISVEEYEIRTSESLVSSADRALAEKKIEESETYLRIIEALVKRGIQIPLCTYEME